MAHDPLEQHDLAAEKPEMVAKLKADYDAWFSDVTGKRDYAKPSRIFLGAPQENPVLLTRQDWRGEGANWTPKGIGHWEVNVVASTRCEVKLRFEPLKADGEAVFTCGDVSAEQLVKAGANECVFKDIHFSAGPARLEAKLTQDAVTLGVNYVEVARRE
jgi:hypothetical protein